MKQNRLLITLCALSLPAIATSAVILNKNTSLDLVNKTNALTYVSSDYSGYRLLTSEYGIMSGVKLVLTTGNLAMSQDIDTVATMNYYLKTSEVTISDNLLTPASKTAKFTLSDNNGKYILTEETKGKLSLSTNSDHGLTYGNAYPNKWEFSFANNMFDLKYYLNSEYHHVKYDQLSSTKYGYQRFTDVTSNLSVYVDVQSVIDAWAVKYLNYPNEEVEGQCVDLFDTAKEVLDDLGDMYKSCLALEEDNADYLTRYTAWAKALGRSI